MGTDDRRPRFKGRVERTGGTDRLVAELRLAGATTLEQAPAVLDDRFNRRFGVPPQCSEPAFRPLDPELFLEQVLSGGPGQHGAVPADTPTAAGAGPQLPGRWKSCRGWMVSSRYATRGAIIAAQEAPPSPVALRNGHQPPAVSPVAERWTAHLAPLVSSQEPEADQADFTDGEVAAAPPATVAPRKPTFPESPHMSLRAIERELGIHRSTVRSYLEAGGPPGWKQRMVPNPSTWIPSVTE